MEECLAFPSKKIMKLTHQLDGFTRGIKLVSQLCSYLSREVRADLGKPRRDASGDTSAALKGIGGPLWEIHYDKYAHGIHLRCMSVYPRAVRVHPVLYKVLQDII